MEEKRHFKARRKLSPRWTTTNPTAGATTKQEFGGLEIPKNLLHKFGEDNCSDVLADLNKVEEVQKRISAKPQKSLGKQSEKQFTQATDYELLSHLVRLPINPGVSVTHDKGVNQSDHNWDVFERRDEANTEYRYQKDKFSKWKEAEVFENRMQKAWKAAAATKPLKIIRPVTPLTNSVASIS